MAPHRRHLKHWPMACLRLARRPSTGGGARLWQVVLLALLFASLHSGLTSAWAAWQGQTPWVQICTTDGMRWVAGDDTRQESPAVLKAGCVWSQAGTALPPLATPLAPTRPSATQTGASWVVHDPPAGDTPTRVLLMAAMRAPPDIV